jgi:hypothetical protein
VLNKLGHEILLEPAVERVREGEGQPRREVRLELLRRQQKLKQMGENKNRYRNGADEHGLRSQPP